MELSDFVGRAVEFRLLTASQVEVASRAHVGNLDHFVELQVNCGNLTRYQVNRLLDGKRDGFFYGANKIRYLVATDRLSRVYRAVDTETGRHVNVAVLRESCRDSVEEFALKARRAGGEMGLELSRMYYVVTAEEGIN